MDFAPFIQKMSQKVQFERKKFSAANTFSDVFFAANTENAAKKKALQRFWTFRSTQKGLICCSESSNGGPSNLL